MPELLTPRARRQKPYIPWWKRRYVVNKRLQGKLAVSAVVAGFMSSVSTMGLLLWTFRSFNIWQGQILPVPVISIVVALVVFNMVAIYCVGILSTHKIVGPLYSLLRYFRQLADGNFTVLARFRDSDEIHYVARQFNEMTIKLNGRNEFIFENIKKANKLLCEGQPEEAQKHLQSLLELREKEENLKAK